MSPSRRYLGSVDRVSAILTNRALYDIGAGITHERVIGHPPVHPPHVLLIFAALGRALRSTVRVETDLLDAENWAFMCATMAATITRHRLDLPPPGRVPPAWHHWRRLRDDHLTTDEGIAQIQRHHLTAASKLAVEIGLLDPRIPGSFTHPSRARTVYGDGTIVRPIYRPPVATRIQQPDGTVRILYPDPHTGELLDAPTHRYDADIAEHHGHRGPVQGHGYVAGTPAAAACTNESPSTSTTSMHPGTKPQPPSVS